MRTTRAWAAKYDIPFLQLVDAKGQMSEETPWAGTFVKNADPIILKELEDEGQAGSARRNSPMTIPSAGAATRR